MKIFTLTAIIVFGFALARGAAVSPKVSSMETDDIFADIHPEDLGAPEHMSDDLASEIQVKREMDPVLQKTKMLNSLFLKCLRALSAKERREQLVQAAEKAAATKPQPTAKSLQPEDYESAKLLMLSSRDWQWLTAHNWDWERFQKEVAAATDANLLAKQMAAEAAQKK